MAKPLDLEEQAQLDQIKLFWKQYGNLITWLLIVVLGCFAAWNGYQYWQRSQALRAAGMYDEVERAARSGDAVKLDRALADMQDRYGSTLYAQQAALLAARAFLEKGNADSARAALNWVADKAGDEGYRAVARLRLAGLLMDAGKLDEAWQRLDGGFTNEFIALAADRRGDIQMARGKKAEARAEYLTALKALDERVEYRRMVEVKLNALGVDPTAKS